MPVVIVTPLIEERDGLTKAFEDLGLTGEERGIGRLDAISYRDGNILLVQGGLGKVEFAVHTQHVLDQLSDVEGIICAGVADALSDTLAIGDVVVATRTVEHDFNWKAHPASLPAFDGYSSYLSTLADLGIEDWPFRLHFGPIASGDEAIIDEKRARELHKVTGALAVAWEGAGGARAAAFSDVPYLEIRAISDGADDEARSVWCENLPSAMMNVATVLHEFSRHMTL